LSQVPEPLHDEDALELDLEQVPPSTRIEIIPDEKGSGQECGEGETRVEGGCLHSEDVEALLSKESDEAVDHLASAGPDEQLEAQQNVIRIQEQRVEKAEQDLAEIKSKLRKQKAGKTGVFKDSGNTNDSFDG